MRDTRSFCAAIGLGNIPSATEKSLWDSRQPGDCGVLRTYLRQFPNGAYADEAERRLQAAETQTREHWTPAERRLPLVVRRSLDPHPDEATAQQDALTRAQDEAEFVCKSFELSEYRLLSATPDAQRWNCFPLNGGVTCGFDGEAVCEVEERRVEQFEVCG